MLSRGVKPVSVAGGQFKLQCHWIILLRFFRLLGSRARIFFLHLKCLISFLRVDGSDLRSLGVRNVNRCGERSFHSRLRAISEVIVERLVHNHQQIWLFFPEMPTYEIHTQSCYAGWESGPKRLRVLIFQKGVLKSLLICSVSLQAVYVSYQTFSPARHCCTSWPNWGRCCSKRRLEAV